MPSVPCLDPDEIRQFLLDRTACDNDLLDELDFDDDTIVAAMKHCLDLFNTTHPLVAHFDPLLPEKFPYRSEMLMYAGYFCLQAKSINMLRNATDVQTEGGTAIRDKAKWQAHLAIARQFLEDVKEQFGIIKRNINVESGYRTIV